MVELRERVVHRQEAGAIEPHVGSLRSLQVIDVLGGHEPGLIDALDGHGDELGLDRAPGRGGIARLDAGPQGEALDGRRPVPAKEAPGQLAPGVLDVDVRASTGMTQIRLASQRMWTRPVIAVWRTRSGRPPRSRGRSETEVIRPSVRRWISSAIASSSRARSGSRGYEPRVKIPTSSRGTM